MEFDELSNRVIGCAIEVHRELGPGLLESTYEQCLAHELKLNGIRFKLQHSQPVEYKGVRLDRRVPGLRLSRGLAGRRQADHLGGCSKQDRLLHPPSALRVLRGETVLYLCEGLGALPFLVTHSK